MKIDRLLAAFAFVAAVTVSPTLAQQQKPATPSAPPATQAAAAMPETKIALINTELFVHETQGVTRLVNAVKGVDREFQPRKTELQGLQQRAQQLTDEITKTSGVAEPRSTQTKQEQLDLLKKDLQRKGEDAQAAYTKRVNEIVGPIYEDLGKALDVYAKQRGITIVFDAAKMGPAIVMAVATIDITAAFVKDFNSKNPATASVAPPK